VKRIIARMRYDEFSSLGSWRKVHYKDSRH
jgi:hypothetical protein